MVSLEGDPKKLSRKRGSERGRERSPWGVSHEQVTSVAADPSGEPCETANCRQHRTQAHSLQGEEEVGVFSICFPCHCLWAALSGISSGFLPALCVGWSCSWAENPSRRVIMSPVESVYSSKRTMSVKGIQLSADSRCSKREGFLGEQGIKQLGRNWTMFRARDPSTLRGLVGYVNKGHEWVGDWGTLRFSWWSKSDSRY